MKLHDLSDRHFSSTLVALCLFYLALQIVYVTRLPLIMDEFAGMAAVLDHRDGIPYRDFNPYKTVLGYYIQTIPTFLSAHTWNRLMAVKLFMAVINTAAIFWAARRLATRLRPPGVLIATLLLVCMSTFLERSSELRVDMLTSIGGLISLVWLMERRLLAAGIATGVALLISQKGVYFCLAGAVTLAAEWALSRERGQAMRDAVLFSIGALMPLALYLAVFSLLASPGMVFNQIFLGPYAIAFKEIYDIRHFWIQTIVRNPLFWALSVLSIILLLRHFDQRHARILSVYGTVILMLGVWHKQPWPYFFVIIIPTCYVLLAALFDQEAICGTWTRNAAIALLVVLGVAYPLSRIQDNLNRDNGFQRYMLEVAEGLLDEEDAYLAGVELIPTRKHVPASLKWLDDHKSAEINAQSDYGSLIEEMRDARLKLIIFNYRVNKLPGPVLAYIKSNYKILVGNVMIYAPKMSAGSSRAHIALPGTYRLLGPGNGIVTIDDTPFAAGDTVSLSAGYHRFDAGHDFRLQLQTPPNPHPRHPEEIVPQRFFPNVYRY